MRIVKGIKEKEAAGTNRADRLQNVEEDLLQQIGKPANWLNLSSHAKRIYAEVGEALIIEKRLKQIDCYALAMLAVELEAWAWANKTINAMNRKKPGSGYKQVYQTGATNITTELVIREKAFKRILELSVKFGLTTRDRLTLKDGASLGMQLDLFEEIGFNVSNG